MFLNARAIFSLLYMVYSFVLLSSTVILHFFVRSELCLVALLSLKIQLEKSTLGSCGGFGFLQSKTIDIWSTNSAVTSAIPFARDLEIESFEKLLDVVDGNTERCRDSVGTTDVIFE